MGRRTEWCIIIVLLAAIVVTSILIFLPETLLFLTITPPIPFLLPLLAVFIILLTVVTFYQMRRRTRRYDIDECVERILSAEPSPEPSEPRPEPPRGYDVFRPVESIPPPPSVATLGPVEEKRMAASGVAEAIQRQATLSYWERMRLEKVYDLIVTLHETGITITAPKGVTVKPFDRVYDIPRDGHVRIIPVCGSLNIAPAYRDVEVAAFEKETSAQFKVVPQAVGTYDLEIEFQFVRRDGKISKLGKETTTVTIQEKDYELRVFGRTLSVSRKIPALFSVCGGFFGFFSFILPQISIDPQTIAVLSTAAVGSGVTSILMIIWAAILLFKSLKPLKTLIPITLKKS
ncbi:MAG: hypothetical protein ACFFCO_04575 [Promethearchaeota archaeon]